MYTNKIEDPSMRSVVIDCILNETADLLSNMSNKPANADNTINNEHNNKKIRSLRFPESPDYNEVNKELKNSVPHNIHSDEKKKQTKQKTVSFAAMDTKPCLYDSIKQIDEHAEYNDALKHLKFRANCDLQKTVVANIESEVHDSMNQIKLKIKKLDKELNQLDNMLEKNVT